MKRKKKQDPFFFSQTSCLQVELCGNAAIEIGYNTIFYMEKKKRSSPIQGYYVNQMK